MTLKIGALVGLKNMASCDKGVKMMVFNDLIAMKKSRKTPCEGDVFVLQPIENVFYYGKVIKTNLISKDSFVNGMTLIYIYNCFSNDKNLPADLDEKDFLIPPIVVNHNPWWKGYFETIGNMGVTECDRNRDFAFWDLLTKKFVDFSGNEVDRQPECWSVFGLGSYGLVGKEVQKAIRMNDCGE